MNRVEPTAAHTGVAQSMSQTKTALELLRFGIVGVCVNLVLYVAYLLLIQWGVDYRLAMSIVYIAGTVLGFVLHRNWTFRSRSAWGGAFGRYVATYASGYVLNLVGLWALVAALGMSRALAQGVMILVVAAFLFVVQKLWIFARTA